ncbi:hypothetical protein SAMN05421780_103136 [Flexibacter flexilis DSM 6793]|uniref:Uncharacterized protein n=1 Tax=Flexibacter flexilis DSM 6793 TaxID=927664 RepID=A0A1I1H632_9BACT|nr:hypothetical protein SAMN05421780_103136 [Flexibacter flexilis DSM 6793]
MPQKDIGHLIEIGLKNAAAGTQDLKLIYFVKY